MQETKTNSAYHHFLVSLRSTKVSDGRKPCKPAYNVQPATHNLKKKALKYPNTYYHVRFEVFTAVTMKNGVFWDVSARDSCKNRRFGGT
jgi:hypothetical protein